MEGEPVSTGSLFICNSQKILTVFGNDSNPDGIQVFADFNIKSANACFSFIMRNLKDFPVPCPNDEACSYLPSLVALQVLSS